MRHKELVEKLVELRPYRGGLKITAGKRKPPKPLENKGFWDLVPVTGLEPVRCRQRWILSPLRLPFHHTGRFIPACIEWEIDRLRCPISSSAFKSLRQLSTASTRSAPLTPPLAAVALLPNCATPRLNCILCHLVQ